MPELDLPAPKDMLANLDFRDAMIRWGSEHRNNAEQIWVRCSRDPEFYCDTFIYTYDPRAGTSLKKVPFILWDYQVAAIYQIISGVSEGEDKLIKKSRDMGATWIALFVFEYMWHFFDDMSFLIASRKEDLVDHGEDSDTLFAKIDMMHDYQPGWLLPTITRKNMILFNEDNKSVINGDSTTGDLGRGGRRSGLLLDEFASVDNGHAVLKSTADVTDCRVFNSTPKGAAGGFYSRVKSMSPEHIIEMHWSIHPKKGKDQFTDKHGKLRSPWYDKEVKRRVNPTEIAQELDINFHASDFMFFDGGALIQYRKDYIQDAVHRGGLVFDHRELDTDDPTISFEPGIRGKLRIWTRLDYSDEPAARTYCAGADISMGTGSSNSVLSIADAVSKEKVAEFATADLGPHEFARYAIAICKFFNEAKLVWEINGPGLSFGKEIKRLKYAHVYYREDQQAHYRRGSFSNKAGWHSSRDT